MPAYMYLRETPSTAPLKEQIKYAQEHQIAEEHMLGPMQYARENCKDITQLIERPLKAGDQLIIRNLFLAGHSHQRIYNVLTLFHKYRIQLQIVDINYFDLVPVSGDPRSENDDYARLTAFLRVFIEDNKRKNLIHTNSPLKPRGKGRPPKNWNTLPSNVREIVMRHCENLYTYPATRALEDINKTGYSLGMSRFNSIKREYKNLKIQSKRKS